VLPKSSVLLCPVYGGKCLSLKAVHEGAKKRGKLFADDEQAETEARMGLRQQSKVFIGRRYDELMKRWHK
jgi:hypothetical protein